MTVVTRLVTLVDLDEGANGPRALSVSALHLAVLGDGSRVVLLDDRGWSESGPDGLWQRTTPEDLAETARTVVGPDEPFDEHTHADMAREHWTGLADTLRRRGVTVSSDELSRLPHDVELSRAIRDRLTT